MESAIAQDRLRTRVLLWAEEETKLKLLHPKAKNLLEALLYRGEVRRGEAPHLIGTSASGSRRPWRLAGCRACFRTRTTKHNEKLRCRLRR
jgi:hypothetical protein